MIPKSATQAYAAIHECLGNAVNACLEDCHYEDAIKYADMMKDLEENNLKLHEAYEIEVSDGRIVQRHQ